MRRSLNGAAGREASARAAPVMADHAISSGTASVVPVTAIVTAFERVPQTLQTLARLRSCQPAPAQVLVHVDGNRQQTAAAIRERDPSAQVLVSAGNIGPGGGRNRLIAAAEHEIVASFDDDSWPIDGDYFERLVGLFEQYPEAAILNAALFHRGEARRPATDHTEWRASFVGAGCAYRRGAFLATGGYVPLPTAYGMEEVDLSLRLHARRGRILHCERLRVEHDTDLAHHGSAEVTAASIANIALLAFLRYPAWMWPVGLAQVANRIWWLLRNGRQPGVVRGAMSIPAHLYAYRSWRAPLPASAVRSYLASRRPAAGAQ